MNRTVAMTAVLTCCLCAQVFGADLVHTTATLSEARTGLAATTVDNKALFAGGCAGRAYGLPPGSYCASDVVDIFDADTGLWSTATLSQGRFHLAATTVGSKALFAGGYHDAWNESNVVDIYDTDTGLWSTATLSEPKAELVATTVGNKAMFTAGSVVDIYDADTGLWSTATLSQARWGLAATAVGHKALFAGGDGWWASDVVDIYDDQSDLWSTATLSQGRLHAAATAVGDKAMFAGGDSGWQGDDIESPPVPSDVVDIYGVGTGLWSTATLSDARTGVAATTVGNTALFSGGYYPIDFVGQSDLDIVLGAWGSSPPTDPRADLNGDGFVGQADLDTVLGAWGGGRDPSGVVDIYDDATGLWSTDALSLGRWGLAATTVGDMAMFAGGFFPGGDTPAGYIPASSSDVVDVFTLAETPVPEPTTLGLLGLGLPALMRRRR